MCMSPSSLGNCTICSTWCIMICLVIPILSLLLLYNPYIPFLIYNLLVSCPFFAALAGTVVNGDGYTETKYDMPNLYLTARTSVTDSQRLTLSLCRLSISNECTILVLSNAIHIKICWNKFYTGNHIHLQVGLVKLC